MFSYQMSSTTPKTKPKTPFLKQTSRADLAKTVTLANPNYSIVAESKTKQWPGAKRTADDAELGSRSEEEQDELDSQGSSDGDVDMDDDLDEPGLFTPEDSYLMRLTMSVLMCKELSHLTQKESTDNPSPVSQQLHKVTTSLIAEATRYLSDTYTSTSASFKM